MDKSAFAKWFWLEIGHSFGNETQNERQAPNLVLFSGRKAQSEQGTMDKFPFWKCWKQIFSKMDEPQKYWKTGHFNFYLGDLESAIKCLTIKQFAKALHERYEVIFLNLTGRGQIRTTWWFPSIWHASENKSSTSESNITKESSRDGDGTLRRVSRHDVWLTTDCGQIICRWTNNLSKGWVSDKVIVLGHIVSSLGGPGQKVC